jgi:hypothetical protein
MRMGFDMRQQAVAAVQAKVLRLNSVAVADQTAGKVLPDCCSCRCCSSEALRLREMLQIKLPRWSPAGAHRGAVAFLCACGMFRPTPPHELHRPPPPPPQIVNLVSNDVRRFDDALPFYNFIIMAPGGLGLGRRKGGTAAAGKGRRGSTAVCVPRLPHPLSVPALPPPISPLTLARFCLQWS